MSAGSARRRRRLVTAVVAAPLLASVLLTGCSAGSDADHSSGAEESGAAEPAETAELPGGGTEYFPGKRLIALYGHPDQPALGALGEQDIDETIARVQGLAADYADFDDAEPVPTLEIIATVATAAPGPDGDYTSVTDPEQLRPWVDAAGEAGVQVLLDLQPGRASFLDQARIYQDLLTEPHVGLALDPEWNLQPDQVHLTQVGTVDAAEVNEVTAWLADLAGPDSPQKLLVVHQFQRRMVAGQDDLEYARGPVRVLVHMDGQGAPGDKEKTWAMVRDATGDAAPLGWKNFYRVDTPMLDPAATMAREPAPAMISYQ